MAIAKEDINTTLETLLEQMAADAANIAHASKCALTSMHEGNRDGAIGATLTVQKEIGRLHILQSTLLELHAHAASK
jgi:hypothetical protein